ncbi:hypothetical protein [Bacteroides sp. 519]|uniref:hypothetical protein n=1 Tax=Bacteroides sp. 519 TaxID=2302937 RepID=UPI0013D72162|nr:hypothetical protein [Bacteroides sp. 519]
MNTILFFVSVLLLVSSSLGYEKTQNGVIVKVKQNNSNDVQLVRLQVVNDKLFMLVQPRKPFLYKRKPYTEFTVTKTKNTVAVATLVTATVSLTTGEVELFQYNTKVSMLKERTFNVVVVDKNKPQGYNVKTKGQVVKYDGGVQTIKI